MLRRHSTLLRVMVWTALALALSFGPKPAHASYYPYEITTITGFLDHYAMPVAKDAKGNYAFYANELEGVYRFIPLAYEAGDTIDLRLGGKENPEILFINKNMGKGLPATPRTADIQCAHFYDYKEDKLQDLNKSVTDFKKKMGISVFQLTGNWAGDNDLPRLPAGTFIIGFNDSRTDKDYDDFIIAATPTPAPGAMWLLGSGLFGLAWLRRRQWS